MFINYKILAAELQEQASDKVEEAKDKASELAADATDKVQGKYVSLKKNVFLIYDPHY
jgi:vacuolar-type H+-ATPase subunit H